MFLIILIIEILYISSIFTKDYLFKSLLYLSTYVGTEAK